MRTPASMILTATYGCALLAALMVFVALRMPATGVRFVETDTAIVLRAPPAAERSLDPDATVRFVGDGEALSQRAGELVADYAPDGSPAAVARWFADRDRLARIVRSPDASIAVGRGAAMPLRPRERAVRDIPVDTWLLLAQAAVFTLLGVWLLAARPGDRGARMFALSCGAIVAASLSGALYDARELTANGALLHALQTINFAASTLSSAALLAMFLCQPRTIVGPRVALALVAAATAWGAACGVGLLPLLAFYLGLLALTASFVAVLLVQWRATRGDPVARSALRWIGLTTMVGSGQIVVAMALPRLLDLPSFAGDGMTIIPLTLVYGGIAFGIGRARMFDLEIWTYRLMLGAVAALGFLAIDAALVSLLRLDGPVAMALTLLAVGYLYLPLRGFIWGRVAGRDALGDDEKLQLATEVAFAASASARREGWRGLLQRLFDPLSIEPADSDVPEAMVAGEGADLLLPATGDDIALRLRYRDGGRRVFGAEQVRLGRQMLALMHRAEIARAEYLRGVGEERQRIARDLHDDVCATLLTGLHREDLGRLQTDVRGAMSDIRTIISGLNGERIELEQALADLRFETAERLSAAGIALDWPLPAVAPPNRLLDYPVYRNLLSSHREAISNVLKHARATRVAVEVLTTDGTLSLVVRDDGRGAAPTDRRAGGGYGIANMHQRLAEIGGAFGFSAGAGGARVEIAIPLR